jgi:TRAP-type mannitol/chloroaromatic compound transport system permease large subunit
MRLKWMLVSVHLVIVLILTQDRCMVCVELPQAQKSVGHTRYRKVTWVMWNLISVCFAIVLVLVQNRCTVYAKRTIGSEIILVAPNGTPR